MSQTTTELKNEIEKSMGLLQTLRDEVRLKVHLAGMDAKEEWKKLEPELAQVERAAEDFSAATVAAVNDAVKRLSKLRSKIV